MEEAGPTGCGAGPKGEDRAEVGPRRRRASVATVDLSQGRGQSLNHWSGIILRTAELLFIY